MYSYYKKHLFTLILVIGVTVSVLAQWRSNLVYNYSFEEYDSIPSCHGALELSKGWKNLNDGPYCNTSTLPIYGTPDFFHQLAPYPYGLPANFRGKIIPNNGNACAGFYCGYSSIGSWREYIGIKLLNILEIGREYVVGFYINRGDSLNLSQLVCNNIGLLFSNDQPHQNVIEYINREPQAYISTIIYDSTWTKYEFQIIADSAYQYLSIGNFFSNENTLVDTIENTIYISGSYYFIDDIFVIPELQIKADTTAGCVGDSIWLKADGGFSSSFWWQNKTTGDSLGVGDSIAVRLTQSATIYLYGDSSETDSINLIIYNYPTLTMPNDTATCEQKHEIMITSNADQFLWNTGSTQQNIEVETTNRYTVSATSNRCTTEDSTYVSFDYPYIEVGNDTTICEGTTIKLEVDEGYDTYLWSTSETTNSINISEEEQYSITVTNGNCTASDNMNLYVNTGTDSLWIPKVFSPNKDGINDVFKIVHAENVTEFSIEIYNRWGNTIFKTEDPLFEWKAENRPEGVYYWVINYKSNCDSGIQKGIITLIR